MSKNYSCSDHLGNEFKNLEEMCNAYGLSSKTYTRRLALGYSKEKALTTQKKF